MKVITNTSPAKCDNCHFTGIVSDLDLATGLQARLDEGADYTPFQCPLCGALVYSLSHAKTSGKKAGRKQGPDS